MQESTAKPQVDEALLRRFQSEIKSKVPYLVESDGNKTFVNPTPLEDLTTALIECARVELSKDFALRRYIETIFDTSALDEGSRQILQGRWIDESLASVSLDKMRDFASYFALESFEKCFVNLRLGCGLLHSLSNWWGIRLYITYVINVRYDSDLQGPRRSKR